VVVALLLFYVVSSKQVVDPNTFEIKASPKTIKELFKELDEGIVKQNSTSLKAYDEANIKYRVNREKYSSMLISLKEQVATKTKEITNKKKYLETLKQRRNALKQIKRPTEAIDGTISETISIIKGKEHGLYDINKRAKQMNKLLKKTERHWARAQKRRLKALEFFKKKEHIK